MLHPHEREDLIPNRAFRRAALRQWLSQSAEHRRAFCEALEIHQQLQHLSFGWESGAAATRQARPDNVLDLCGRLSNENLERLRQQRDRNTDRPQGPVERFRRPLEMIFLLAFVSIPFLHADHAVTYGASMGEAPRGLFALLDNSAPEDEPVTRPRGDDLVIRDRDAQFSIHRNDGSATTVAVMRGEVELSIGGGHPIATVGVREHTEPGRSDVKSSASLSVQIPAGHQGEIISDPDGPTVMIVKAAARVAADVR
jgi:hypothetical protein